MGVVVGSVGGLMCSTHLETLQQNGEDRPVH